MVELSLRIEFIPIGEVMIKLLEPIASGKGRLSEFLDVWQGNKPIAFGI